ncbi:D(2)-like dopamine receptor [Branchiostoma floridae]|uniref:D(2)-like dopamine receptor n=1 Tax=Branchiostoma floridae TaxID=7739 RepID=A0A9J7KUW4_BRAFL|nr:D(2)-like dopamine receptor [Branchiostoma floridae]
MCKLNVTIQGVSVAASVYTLSVIAVERYYVVLYPAELRMSGSTVRKALAGIWGGAALIMLPQPFVLETQKYDVVYRDGETATYCHENWPAVEYRHAYTLTLFVFVYCGPLVAVTCIYCRIGVSIWYRSSLPVSTTMEPSHRVIRQGTNQPRVIGQDHNLSQVIGQDHNLSQVIGQDHNLSQVIGQDHNLSQVIGQDHNLSQVIGQDHNLSQVIGQDHNQPQIMGQNTNHTQVISHDISQPRVIDQSSNQPQVMGQDPGQSRVTHGGHGSPRVTDQNTTQPRAIRQHTNHHRFMRQGRNRSAVTGQDSSQSPVMGQDASQSRVMGQDASQSRVMGQVPKRRIRVTKMLVTVVAMFALSWLPLYVSWMLDDFGSLSEGAETTLFYYVYPVAHWVAYFNSCVNPIIYGLFRSDVRKNLPSRASSRRRKISMTTSRKRTSLLRYMRRRSRQETAL